MRINIRSFNKRNPIILRFVFLAVSTAFFTFSGCKEDPNMLGRGILPPGDDMFVKIDSSAVVEAYTIRGKHIVTTGNSLHPLGSLRDSVFGYSTAGIVAQYRPTALTAPSTVVSIDSVFLILKITRAFGDSINPQTVRVFELTEQLPLDTVYYSDYDVTGKYDTEEIGSATFTPNDSIIIIPLLRQDYASKFIAQPDSVYEKIDNFISVFKGFYIKTDNVADKGGYAMINFQLLSTRMDVHYNGGVLTSNLYTFYFANDVAKFSVFDHDYTSYPVSNNLDLSESNDSVLFVEGLAGVSVRLKFPAIDTFLTGAKIGINKASLVIPVERLDLGSADETTYPSTLMLFKLKNDGEYGYLEDYIINKSYFNGFYDVTKKAYVFNIGLYLQSYIGRKIDNSEFVLVSYTSSETPNKVVLKGTTGSKGRIKLFVTYTQLP